MDGATSLERAEGKAEGEASASLSHTDISLHY